MFVMCVELRAATRLRSFVENRATEPAVAEGQTGGYQHDSASMIAEDKRRNLHWTAAEVGGYGGRVGAGIRNLGRGGPTVYSHGVKSLLGVVFAARWLAGG